jgi:hypothetical protein
MYFNSSYKLNSSGHAHLTSDQILIYNKKLRHKSTSCLNENKIENNARPRQPRRKQPEKAWCTRAPPRPRGCVLRLWSSFAPRPRSLWSAAEAMLRRRRLFHTMRRCCGPQSAPELHMVVALELHLVLARARACPVVIAGTGETRPRASRVMALVVAQILAQQQQHSKE